MNIMKHVWKVTLYKLHEQIFVKAFVHVYTNIHKKIVF